MSDEVSYDSNSTSDVIGTTTVVLDKGQEQEISVFEWVYASVSHHFNFKEYL